MKTSPKEKEKTDTMTIKIMKEVIDHLKKSILIYKF